MLKSDCEPRITYDDLTGKPVLVTVVSYVNCDNLYYPSIPYTQAFFDNKYYHKQALKKNCKGFEIFDILLRTGEVVYNKYICVR